MKAPKLYKPIYRAIWYQFSPRIFYEKCGKASKIIIVIDTEDSGVICSYIEPSLDIPEQGLDGVFVADELQKSFIYSSKNQ